MWCKIPQRHCSTEFRTKNTRIVSQSSLRQAAVIHISMYCIVTMYYIMYYIVAVIRMHIFMDSLYHVLHGGHLHAV